MLSGHGEKVMEPAIAAVPSLFRFGSAGFIWGYQNAPPVKDGHFFLEIP
jgi:hypothetical protein